MATRWRWTASDLLPPQTALSKVTAISRRKINECCRKFQRRFHDRLADGSERLMNFWMLGEPERRVFSVAAPAIMRRARSCRANWMKFQCQLWLCGAGPMRGENVHSAVYEPSLASEGAAIERVRAAKTEGENSSRRLAWWKEVQSATAKIF